MKTSAVIADGTFECSTAVLQGPIEEVAAAAAEIGYDAVQLTVNDPADIDVDRILAALAPHGLAVSALATGRVYTVGRLGMGCGDEDLRQACVERMRGHVDVAARLGGAAVIIGAVRGWTTDASSPAEYHRQFDTSVAELIAYAEPRGVPVILEANDHLETDVFISIEETAAYVRRWATPAFRLHLDTMHMLYENEDIRPRILETADITYQVDISGEARSCPDGAAYDYPLVIASLKEAGYDGYVTFEIVPSPPANAAKVAFDYITGLLEA